MWKSTIQPAKIGINLMLMHWRTCFICTQISYLATTMFKWTDVVGNLATCFLLSLLLFNAIYLHLGTIFDCYGTDSKN